MKLHPVFVVSKSRPDQKLYSLLDESHIDWTVVVEPQDEDAYRKVAANRSVMVLPENNRGICYVRQYLLEHARKKGLVWYWMLDDDITNFYYSGQVVTARYALSSAEKLINQLWNEKNIPVAQAALEYSQYSWSAKSDYALNSYCDVAVIINSVASFGCNYREEAHMKEDRDFTLQILSNGGFTCRLRKIGFSCPKNGSNKGGLYDEYKAGKEENASKQLASLWPNVVSLQTKSDGRKDAKIDWSTFKVQI